MKTLLKILEEIKESKRNLGNFLKGPSEKNF